MVPVRLTTKSVTPSRALDPSLYTDPAVLERELDGLFQRTWQYVGHTADLPGAGSYLTAVCGDQPVLVLRGDGSRLIPFVMGRIVRDVDLEAGVIVVPDEVIGQRICAYILPRQGHVPTDALAADIAVRTPSH